MSGKGLVAAGLFSGIGGFEVGFEQAGITSRIVCEIDEPAAAVLKQRLPTVLHHSDICTLKKLPAVDVVAGGFPCQNLSLVGMNAGIQGRHSSLINEVFRLIKPANQRLKWVVLENVPFMLWHRKGEAIQYVISHLEALGFRWAYRVIDARSFGLPQRRRRVIIVASRTEDPCSILFGDQADAPNVEDDGLVPCGFSWTEGRLGLGWAINCVPTLKAGSSVGVISPPAIWMRNEKRIVTPNLRDAERLQGFKADWTDVKIEDSPVKVGSRWRMVGNAVPVPLARWIGEKLMQPGAPRMDEVSSAWSGGTWPTAAWGHEGKVFKAHVSEWPVQERFVGLDEFLTNEVSPLSIRASAGFLKRAKQGSLRFAPGFLSAVEAHIESMQTQLELAA